MIFAADTFYLTYLGSFIQMGRSSRILSYLKVLALRPEGLQAGCHNRNA
jgi:hypothetical protein